ncbi:hypothetical protein ACFC1T_08195 [Kitasatospora sp. NPDC056076]|uniref:hypothetical protein n=1 Tax=Kitasatospora sp. NPDC056076 TaxID=3345703 RepID=UPI0035E098F7
MNEDVGTVVIPANLSDGRRLVRIHDRLEAAGEALVLVEEEGVVLREDLCWFEEGQ